MARVDKVVLCSTCQVTSGYQIVMNGVTLACLHTQEHAREVEDIINYRHVKVYDKYGFFKEEKIVSRGNKMFFIQAQLPQVQEQPEHCLQESSLKSH